MNNGKQKSSAMRANVNPRPAVHFAPEKNWMNDPNGTIFTGGLHHLFYQYNPYGAEWGNICWAYATSPDLINWKRGGVKLSPQTQQGEQWCFSGCTFAIEDRIKLLYTTVGFGENSGRDHSYQTICDCDGSFESISRVATLKSDVNPFPVQDWRDPFVFEHGGQRFLVVAGVWQRGNVLAYEATDPSLNSWRYLAPLVSVENDVLECPNAALYGDKTVVIYCSVKQNAVNYQLGDFDGKRFLPQKSGVIDYGVNCFYATNLARLDDGKYVLYGWLRESLNGSSSLDGTYSGCLAIPRIMDYDGEHLTFSFAPALYDLIDRELSPKKGENGQYFSYDGSPSLIKIQAEQCEFALLENEEEGVYCSVEGGALTVTRKTSFKDCDTRILQMPVGGGVCSLEILVDGTVIEIVANKSKALSMRFYRQSNAERLLRFGEGTCAVAYSLNTPEIY